MSEFTYRVHHGLQDNVAAMDIEAALSIARIMLMTGRTNILIAAEGREVTGRADYYSQPVTPVSEGRIGTLVLEIAIMK